MTGCVYVVRPARYVDPEPPVFCDEDTVQGEPYCPYHMREMGL